MAGFDKIQITRDSKTNIEKNLEKLNEFEPILATDEKKLYTKIFGSLVDLTGLGSSDIVNDFEGGDGVASANIVKTLKSLIDTNTTALDNKLEKGSYTGNAGDLKKLIDTNKSDILLKVDNNRIDSKDWSTKPIPAISDDGVIEIGKHLDFHEESLYNDDYTIRLTSKNGKLYLTEKGGNGIESNILGEISKSENGWVKFANGLILQWGIIRNVGGRFGVGLNVSFSVRNYIVIPTMGNADSIVTYVGVVDANKTESYFELRCQREEGDVLVNWFAIGY